MNDALQHLQAVEEAVIAMEARGFALDVAYCHRQAGLAREAERATLDRLAVETAALGAPPLPGIDDVWSSGPQLRSLVHDVLDAPPSPVWKKGQVRLDLGERKLDETALSWIALRSPKHRPLLDSVIELRRTRGSIKYLEKLPTFVAPDGRVHPICGPASDDDSRVGAVTGRLALKKPEGQQFPNDPEKDKFGVRGAIVAAPGNALVVCDFSQLEVVLLADILIGLFDDWHLAEMVAVGAPDLHSTNARSVFGRLGWTLSDGTPVSSLPLESFREKGHEAARLRHQVKSVWYGLMYGKGAYGFGSSLTDDLGNPIGEEAAGQIVEALLDSVPGIRDYQNWVRRYIKEKHGIPSFLGRWCPLDEFVSEGTQKSLNRAWRRALNFPMQAGGADTVGLAMVEVEKSELLRKADWGTVLQVHDELVLEGPEAVAPMILNVVKKKMEAAGEQLGLRVPLQVSGSIGKTYLEAK